MKKKIFKPVKMKDPLTGKERVVTPEEQEAMLEKGIFLGAAVSDKSDDGVGKDQSDA
ncbi:hypothetical protein ACFL0Z_00815 [Patescibacteria group bacterium]